MRRELETLFGRYQRRGDMRALGLVFDRTARDLLMLAQHLVRDVDDAEDLVQATFVTAIDRAPSWDAERPLRPWLAGILAYKAANLRRGRYRRDERALDDGETDARAGAREADPAAGASAREVRREIDAAIERLDERDRLVLAPYLQNDRRAEEIARELGRAPGTVRSQIHRGLERLRQKLPRGVHPGVLALPRGLDAMRADVLRHAQSASTVASHGNAAPIAARALRSGGYSPASLWLAVPIVALIVGSAWWTSRPDEARDPAFALRSRTSPPSTRPFGESPPPSSQPRLDHERATPTRSTPVVHQPDEHASVSVGEKQDASALLILRLQGLDAGEIDDIEALVRPNDVLLGNIPIVGQIIESGRGPTVDLQGGQATTTLDLTGSQAAVTADSIATARARALALAKRTTSPRFQPYEDQDEPTSWSRARARRLGHDGDTLVYDIRALVEQGRRTLRIAAEGLWTMRAETRVEIDRQASARLAAGHDVVIEATLELPRAAVVQGHVVPEFVPGPNLAPRMPGPGRQAPQPHAPRLELVSGLSAKVSGNDIPVGAYIQPVALFRSGEAKPTVEGALLADGSFRLKVPAGGPYTLAIAMHERPIWSDSVYLRLGRVYRLGTILNLPSRTRLTGRVLDGGLFEEGGIGLHLERHLPADAPRVRWGVHELALHEGKLVTSRAVCTTQEDNRFQFTGATPGNYQLRVGDIPGFVVLGTDTLGSATVHVPSQDACLAVEVGALLLEVEGPGASFDEDADSDESDDPLEVTLSNGVQCWVRVAISDTNGELLHRGGAQGLPIEETILCPPGSELTVRIEGKGYEPVERRVISPAAGVSEPLRLRVREASVAAGE